MENKKGGGHFERNLVSSGWAPVSRKAMDDQALTVEARGVLGWLLTRPDGHRLYLHYLQTRLKISQGRWQKIRKELVAAGYLTVRQDRSDDGKWTWIFTLTDTPSPEKPSVENPPMVCPPVGNPSVGNRPINRNKNTKNITSVRLKMIP